PVWFRNILAGIIIIIALVSITYRGIASEKYLPVIFGKQSKSDFLSKHLNYSFGDFYDTDGYFANHISQDKKVLLFGFHNLYYVDFPFIDNSWVKPGDRFDYIALQNTALPGRFKFWDLIYQNPKT